SIPIILQECLKAGVRKQDIKLICSNGLHRKNTKEEIRSLLGEKVFNDYYYDGQIVNHDSEDWDNLVDLGKDDMGNPVIMNREVFESDLAVLIGHALGNPYGGYSGGYKHCTTGITHWRSIGSHHNPHVMHGHDFTPVNSKSTMRRKFDAIGMHMEKKMGRKFFCCDAVLDTYARQIAVFSGYAEAIQPLCWEVADKRTYVHWADKKYDIMVFGMPQAFHYGNGMGTNPILMLQAISAQVVRHKRVLSDRAVIICSSICNGYFHDEEFPAYREIFDLFQRDYANTLPDVEKFGEYVSENKAYIDKYRYSYGYHPFHGFSMISCGHIAEMNTSAIYIVGAQEPGYARAMGMKTRATFEEALADAKKKYAGEDANILALPKTFTTAAVHLCPKV
ncbi:MAG: lactate racemase domain-containing protein, partial [Christensenellales bacterium]